MSQKDKFNPNNKISAANLPGFGEGDTSNGRIVFASHQRDLAIIQLFLKSAFEGESIAYFPK